MVGWAFNDSLWHLCLDIDHFRIENILELGLVLDDLELGYRGITEMVPR